MTAGNRRRAIVIGRYNSDAGDMEVLITRHRLEVVFTVFGPSAPKLATLIAVQHIVEHDAEVVVIPHLTGAEIRSEPLWRAVTELADILTADGAWLQTRSI